MAGVDPAFWDGRRVLLTGHTGFKGAWLTLWLTQLGANVTGVSDEVPTDPSLFALARLADDIDDRRADVRDQLAMTQLVSEVQPEVVIHMAAQPFVRRSFAEPVETYATNVMGTVNVLDAVRTQGRDVLAIVNVTSDKCYDNREQRRPFTEDDCMGGHDPYSNSKGCAELVADAYRRSYEMPLASARAGNVVGGGDWGEDRLIPDVMQGALAGAPIRIRNPEAIRPWQHVLNPLSGYLLIAERLAAGDPVAEGWNFGPAQDDAKPVRWIADQLTAAWPQPLAWEFDEGPHPHEAAYLALDSTKAREQLGWRPRWALPETIDRIVEWYAALRDGADMRAMTARQLDAFTAA
ncbi:MAG: CDP-glucose 4,6-dehydratase [Solirubrobacteraceae bacterium]|nr:CDP-glucose 4,6-dehydratase [Solirubrobacteraceae bacterium]